MWRSQGQVHLAVFCGCVILLRSSFANSAPFTIKDVEEQQGEFIRSLSDYSIVYPEKVFGDRVRRSDGIRLRSTFRIALAGESLLLDLHQSSQFISPRLVIHRYVDGRVVEESLSEDSLLCHYIGEVRGHRLSSAAVSICGGLSGMFLTRKGDYFMEPVRAKNSSVQLTSSGPHLVYKRSPSNHEPKCHAVEIDQDTAPADYKVKTRQRRSPTELKEWTIETAVVADHTVADVHKNDTVPFLLTVMNLVRLLYRNPSIGHAISVVVVDLVLLDKRQTLEVGLQGRQPAGSMIRKFCRWQNSKKRVEYDNAVLVTRADLCKSNEAILMNQCTEVGVANMAGMCDRTQACSVNQDRGLAVAFIIAHEMGHNLGMRHDGESGNFCKPQEGMDKMLMAANTGQNSNPFKWSTCSRNYLTAFLESGQARCLERNGSHHAVPTALPGNFTDPTRQCQMVYGQNAVACDLKEICKALYCESPGRFCHTNNFPAAEGTRCLQLNGDDGVCHLGNCVLAQTIPKDVNGQWGEWGDYQECSRSCGGGMQVSERPCNNPLPKGLGRYCVGQWRRYRICSTALCMSGSLEYRDAQCHDFDGRDASASGALYTDPLVTWEAVYETTNTSDPRICRLTCYSKRKRKRWSVGRNVIDGTRCFSGSSSYCIRGKCLSVGCDDMVGSSAVEDRCRVCNGDNSKCRQVSETKVFRPPGNSKSGIIIPRGSVHINFTETTPSACLLELLNSQNTNIIQEFDRSKSTKIAKDYQVAGTIFNYVASPYVVESLYALGPTTEDLKLKVIFRNQESLSMTYSFNVPNSSYEWRIKIDHCSASCVRRSILECRRRDDGHAVLDTMCSEEPKPSVRDWPCNMSKCNSRRDKLQWMVSNWRKCNTTCGRGFQHRFVSCLLTDSGTGVYHTQVSDDNCPPEKPRDKKGCLRPPCPAVWEHGTWGECTSSCGYGNKLRTVKCVRLHTKEVVSDHHCLRYKPKPKISDECFSRQGCQPVWKVQEWSPCTATCGAGRRNRNVTCQIPSLGSRTSSKSCDVKTKPDTEKACYRLTCFRNCTEEDIHVICRVLKSDSVEGWCRTPLRSVCRCACQHVTMDRQKRHRRRGTIHRH